MTPTKSPSDMTNPSNKMKTNSSKPKGQNKEIIIPILNNEYKIIVCWGSEEYVRKVGWNYRFDTAIHLPKENRGIAWYHKGSYPIIILRGYPKLSVEFATLAHEAYHAVKYIMRDIEETDADEVIGHSIGAVMRETLESKP